MPEGDYFERGRAAALLGLAYWASGDLETGHRTFADALASFQMAGNVFFAISGTFILADIRMVQGRLHEAVSTYERSLQLAEPQGYVRIFVDEGPPMAALLREAAKHGIAPNYISQLRAAFGKAEGRTPVTQLLIEPLSERELEVLRLLGTELNGPEIARELTVSLHTIRTHTQNIYNKLGVNKRRAAVRRAEELDLL